MPLRRRRRSVESLSRFAALLGGRGLVFESGELSQPLRQMPRIDNLRSLSKARALAKLTAGEMRSIAADSASLPVAAAAK